MRIFTICEFMKCVSSLSPVWAVKISYATLKRKAPFVLLHSIAPAVDSAGVVCCLSDAMRQSGW